MSDDVKYDWLVCRLWGKVIEKVEICLLTTRGFLLARYVREHIRETLMVKGKKHYKEIKGLRRYRTEKRATQKAAQLNKKFNTAGYESVREDEI